MNFIRLAVALIFVAVTQFADAGYYVQNTSGSYTSACYLTLGVAVEAAWPSTFGGSQPTITAINTTALTVTTTNNNGAQTLSFGTCAGLGNGGNSAPFTGGVIDPAFTSGGTSLDPVGTSEISALNDQVATLQGEVTTLNTALATQLNPVSDFDPIVAGEVFGFFLSSVMLCWYVAKGFGAVLSAIRRF